MKKPKITISGGFPGGIIGIRQPNGEYPRIVANNDEVFFSGIYIDGSNKFLEYIIIENVLDNGVTINGDNNILDHIISRYNSGSGFAIYGNFNTFNYCYSYRNCGTNVLLIKADGFSIFGETNNVFNYCFAWDNSNSGFNYERINNSSELSFLHCGSWNNGNIFVFTGKYDYDSGNPLDKNLRTIQKIMENDPNFVSNYYNKKYSTDNAYLDGYTLEKWISQVRPILEGNGFTLGHRNNTQGIEVKRNLVYCIAFDHNAGGFIDNYIHRYNAFITNCVSFNNGINYKLPYTFTKWSNNWSWGTRNKDQINEAPTKNPNNNIHPSNINTILKSIYTVRNQIIKAVISNMFPDGINFDNAINNLKE